MKLRLLNYLAYSVCITLSSCGNNIYENYHSFNYAGWNTDSIVKFRYTVTDTINAYDLRLKIRHTVDYNFQNLFLFLKDEKKDTIEIILANKNGKWTGSGISNIREVEYVFDRKRHFKKKGEYSLSVEQAMRYGDLHEIERLDHILDVGLMVSKNNE